MSSQYDSDTLEAFVALGGNVRDILPHCAVISIVADLKAFTSLQPL